MSAEQAIVVVVERIRCGHSSRLGAARVQEGEPYVLAHHQATTLPELASSLAETGHAFSVRVVERHVSILEWSQTV